MAAFTIEAMVGCWLGLAGFFATFLAGLAGAAASEDMMNYVVDEIATKRVFSEQASATNDSNPTQRSLLYKSG
jgi:hypothetical protein